jgi:hypothetical protein
MRPLRVRVTVRAMMVLVAVVALGLAIAEEFQDGSPPRFVLRGIPGRIARLRPGMTPEQTRAILGLEQTWLTGGTSARFAHFIGNARSKHEVYYVRPPTAVVRTVQMGGSSPTHVTVLESTAMIQLVFRMDFAPGTQRLVSASFRSGSTTVAEMPESP